MCFFTSVAKKRKLGQLSDSTPEKSEKSEKSENVPDNAQIVVKRKNAFHILYPEIHI